MSSFVNAMTAIFSGLEEGGERLEDRRKTKLKETQEERRLRMAEDLAAENMASSKQARSIAGEKFK